MTMVVPSLMVAAIVAWIFWDNRTWRKCETCRIKFKSYSVPAYSNYRPTWGRDGTVVVRRPNKCRSCDHAAITAEVAAHEAEQAARVEELEKKADDPTVHVRERLEARKAARLLGSRKV